MAREQELRTNAMRLLEAAGIPYVHHSFPFVEVPSAPEVAALLKVPPEQVFKTLVTTNGHPGGIFVFVVQGNAELDLKKAAKAAGEKSLAMLKSRDLFPTVGYVHGGCSPLGLKRPFPVFIDEMAQLEDTIILSAGAVGHQVEVSPGALAALLNAPFAELQRS